MMTEVMLFCFDPESMKNVVHNQSEPILRAVDSIFPH
ncbi:hypothetical protein QN277_001021 [Acacia crassicarpa]|uniref:Uncharacterized protein n=1 Tax=Acacia crassicarpa TaxID=499986 RepID=A0AAE1N7R1_9FABA|nr:hypothetical protein QN277_001021 [Acacia crassicarpa]